MEKPGVHFVIEEEYIAITLAEGVLAAGVLMHEGQCASIAERGSHRNVVLGMAIVVKVAPHASILVEVGPPHLHVRICDARQAPKHSGVRRLHLAVRPLDLLAAHAAPPRRPPRAPADRPGPPTWNKDGDAPIDLVAALLLGRRLVATLAKHRHLR
eukprot:CAMPEP_0176029886 /NCGR_PEP_ID=MMETSP0120_2-20121206/14693_1 /TAXON_ID=160619 /ORGANISM="Kryptoperidinium foliaceum, Strain CCMP 1326" /LENGTH=155 /DNA_ID=CAMNT_0017363119 /DNA_START=118 /DNA_END=585 /DNA_ORIENTATION=+